MYLYTYIYIYIYIYIYKYVCMYVCMYVCIFIYAMYTMIMSTNVRQLYKLSGTNYFRHFLL